jgi:hypothetical protein
MKDPREVIAEWHSTTLHDALKNEPKTIAEFRKQIEQERIEISILLQLIIDGELLDC